VFPRFAAAQLPRYQKKGLHITQICKKRRHYELFFPLREFLIVFFNRLINIFMLTQSGIGDRYKLEA